MKRDIVYNLKNLRTKSTDVESLDDANRIICDLEDSLDPTKGIGLSGVQIGCYKRVAIIRWRGLHLNLVNPKILDKKDPIKFEECCLSLPGVKTITKRYKEFVYENGLEGDRRAYVAVDYEAIIIAHEIDHLNGRTILDAKWKKRGNK